MFGINIYRFNISITTIVSINAIGYGVGSPSPMPFEYNIEKNNLTDGYILKAFALLGFDKKAEAVDAIEEARKLNPYDFRIFAFEKISQ